MERHFGLVIPSSEAVVFYSEGIRLGSSDLKKENIKGEKGYAAADGGFNPTHAFIMNFGHLANRNVVTVNEEMAKKFANGENLPMNLGNVDKYVIIRWNGHTIGLGKYDKIKGQIISKIPQKTKREIINTIRRL